MRTPENKIIEAVELCPHEQRLPAYSAKVSTVLSFFWKKNGAYNVSSRKYSKSLAGNQQRNNLQVLSEPKPTCKGQASVFLLKEGDESCEPYLLGVASRKQIWTLPSGLRNVPVLFRRGILQSLLKNQATVLCGLLLAVGMTMSWIPSCSAEATTTGSNFNSFNCIKALVGEVEGESYLTKLATAECLRNRGTLKGVYGINSKRIAKASKKVWEDCEMAWNQSSRANLVKGATVWGNSSDVKIFKKSKWFKSYVQTAKVGNHFFFKLKTKKRGVK
jgi:hypothetical protein